MIWRRIRVSLTPNLLFPLHHPASKETNKYKNLQKILKLHFSQSFTMFLLKSGAESIPGIIEHLSTSLPGFSEQSLLKYKKRIHTTALLEKELRFLPQDPRPQTRGLAGRNTRVLRAHEVASTGWASGLEGDGKATSPATLPKFTFTVTSSSHPKPRW